MSESRVSRASAPGAKPPRDTIRGQWVVVPLQYPFLNSSTMPLQLAPSILNKTAITLLALSDLAFIHALFTLKASRSFRWFRRQVEGLPALSVSLMPDFYSFSWFCADAVEADAQLGRGKNRSTAA